MKVEKIVTKVNSLIRGHLARSRFKKIRFIYLVTDKKAHQVYDSDLNKIPRSNMRLVQIKEQEFGKLKINDQHKKMIRDNRIRLKFMNGHHL